MERKKSLLRVYGLAVLIFAGSMSGCAQSKKSDTADNKEGVEAKADDAAAGKMISLDKASFLKNVYNYEANPDGWKYEGKKPAIVDFYADWCGPCRQIAPILEDLAKVYANDIVIYKVDVDNEKEIAAAFGIQSIPALLFIPMEGKPTMLNGVYPREELEKNIKEILLKK